VLPMPEIRMPAFRELPRSDRVLSIIEVIFGTVFVAWGAVGLLGFGPWPQMLYLVVGAMWIFIAFAHARTAKRRFALVRWMEEMREWTVADHARRQQPWDAL
jgi:hypothetical protein